LENPFDFKIFPTNTMGFKPVNFRLYNHTIFQLHCGNTFHFSPMSFAIGTLEMASDFDAPAGSNHLDLFDFAKNLKLHPF